MHRSHITPVTFCNGISLHFLIQIIQRSCLKIMRSFQKNYYGSYVCQCESNSNKKLTQIDDPLNFEILNQIVVHANFLVLLLLTAQIQKF